MSTLRKVVIISLTLALIASPLYAYPGAGSTPASADSTPASAGPSALAGKVVQTMDAAGYTYVQLESNGQKTWSAIPQTAVKVGDEVEMAPGMPMHNFTSKSVNHTFDTIYFSQGIVKR